MKNTTIYCITWFVIAMIICILGLTGCASMEREFKDFSSEMSGGLDRTLVVYDYNGDVLKEYEGKMDIQVSPSNDKVLFDLDGKRHIIRGGIVIIDEK